MDVGTIFELLDNILTSKPVDAASMQVFDAIALCAKQDTQMRTLAKYIASNMAMEFDIDVTQSSLTILKLGNEDYCDIAVDRADNAANGKLTIKFLNRSLFNAIAYSIVGETKIAMPASLTDNNTVTVTGISAYATIHIKFF